MKQNLTVSLVIAAGFKRSIAVHVRCP